MLRAAASAGSPSRTPDSSTNRAADAGVADKRLLSGVARGGTGLLDAAHAAGIRVDAWTYRDDHVAAGYPGVTEELIEAMTAGVDGLFCDFPATALALRGKL